jgi:hypothetical protein
MAHVRSLIGTLTDPIARPMKSSALSPTGC